MLEHKTLKIPKNTKIEEPVRLSSSSVDIIAEENSRSTIICDYANNIKITAKKGSEITYYRMQTASCTQIEIKQEENSKVNSKFIGKDAEIANETVHVELTERNASYDAIGLILLLDSQVLNYKLTIEHLAPNCTSNVLFKGVIDDKATGDFNCLVIVHPDAYKTETHVTNKNLLLSESATMNTSPGLEIYTDDVICTHGATVGQLDQDALFYLRSRGISEDKAIQLLTTAFTQEIMDQLNYEH